VEDMLGHYTRRRALMLRELSKIKGMQPIKQEGTFCFYINIKRTGIGSDEAAERLLKEAGVLTTPGTVFGSTGEGYLRLSFATSEENIVEGMNRMSAFFDAL